MVTFRFYVVTTVALFLALAIGIVVGSALDERLVAGLESQVERVQANLDDTIESIDAKNDEIERELAEVAGALEGSLAALRRMSSELARTVRDGVALAS